MKRQHVLTIAIASIALGYVYINSVAGNFDNIIQAAKHHIPTEVREYLKETVFVFSNQKYLKEELARLKKQLAKKKEQLAAKTRQLSNKDRQLVALSKNLRRIEFARYGETEGFEVNKKYYLLTKFSTGSLLYGKHAGSVGSSYLDFHNEKLFLASATGLIGYVNSEEFSQNRFDIITIPTNISDLVTRDDFFVGSRYGVKDLLIHDNKIYLSYTKELKHNCFNTSILVSDLSLIRLEFVDFFSPIDCVHTKNVYGQFNAHSSGGRMVPYKKNKILLTVGEYKFRDHAQDKTTLFGKILSIDRISKDTQIISMGHRNPQGLYYFAEEDQILLTEHGPQGGDEININTSPGGEVENYGWPISSYGEHYGFSNRDDSHPLYKKAPLYKSHEDYGYIEPVKYFTPSIAISELVRIPAVFNGIHKRQYFVSAMGDNMAEGDMSVHHIVFNDDNTIIESNVIPVNERIRDMIYVEELNSVILFLETSASIGILEAR